MATTPHVLIIDLDRCIGCWACAIACKMKNNLPQGEWWLRVDTVGQDSGERTHYRPIIERCSYSSGQAARGAIPECAKACPVDAMRFIAPDAANSRIAAGADSPDATYVGNPPGSAFAVTYLPVRAQKRQRRSGYFEP